MSALACGCDPEARWVCAAHQPLEGTRVPPDQQPAIYPCGCSKNKVNAGLCDLYRPGELPAEARP